MKISGIRLGLFFVCVAYSASAPADYTGMNYAVDMAYENWVPVATSPNSKWIAYVYGNELHVVSTSELEQEKRYPFTLGLSGLAISDNGRRLVVHALRGCSAVVNLPAEQGSVTEIKWLPGFGWVDDYKGWQQCTTENVARSWLGKMSLPPPIGIAISSDGNRIARVRTDRNGNGSFEVSEPETNKVVRTINERAEYLQLLQFTNSGTGLLAAATTEYFALWSVDSGKLVKRVPDQRGGPYSPTFALYVDSVSGVMYSFDPKGNITRSDLRNCAVPSRVVVRNANNMHADALVVDPFERWYAMSAQNLVRVFKMPTGKQLAEWHLPAPSNLLRASAEGDKLIVMTRFSRGMRSRDGQAEAPPAQFVYKIPGIGSPSDIGRKIDEPTLPGSCD